MCKNLSNKDLFLVLGRTSFIPLGNPYTPSATGVPWYILIRRLAFRSSQVLATGSFSVCTRLEAAFSTLPQTDLAFVLAVPDSSQLKSWIFLRFFQMSVPETTAAIAEAIAMYKVFTCWLLLLMRCFLLRVFPPSFL